MSIKGWYSYMSYMNLYEVGCCSLFPPMSHDLPSLHPDDSADWEKELQQELQEYEVVTESDNKDDQWDQEIEKMLQADDS